MDIYISMVCFMTSLSEIVNEQDRLWDFKPGGLCRFTEEQSKLYYLCLYAQYKNTS